MTRALPIDVLFLSTSCFKINAITVGVHNFTAQFAFDLEIIHLLRLICFIEKLE